MSRGSSASYAGIIKYRDFSKKIFPIEKYQTAKKKKKKEKKKKTDQKTKRSFNHITNLHLRQIRVPTKFGSEDIKIRMWFQRLH